MLESVKICPKCHAENPDTADGCQSCGEFLGFVMAAARQALAQPEPPLASSPPLPPVPEPAAQPPVLAAQPLPAAAGHPSLYLEHLGSGKLFDARDQFVLGQAHPTSSAQIQLSGLPGVGFLHRRHCLFQWLDGAWAVTPLSKGPGQESQTNPTFLNGVKLALDTPRAVKNGDRLRLSGMEFMVRVLA